MEVTDPQPNLVIKRSEDNAGEEPVIAVTKDPITAPTVAKSSPATMKVEAEPKAQKILDALNAEIFDRKVVDEGVEAFMVDEEQEEALVDTLPPIVQQKIETYKVEADPEDVIMLNSMELHLENAVAAFEALNFDEEADPEKIAEAEAVAAGLYDEILQKIGIEDQAEREQLVEEFIAQIRARAELKVQNAVEVLEDTEADIVDNRLKAPVLSFVKDLSSFTKHLLGKFTVAQAQKLNA